MVKQTTTHTTADQCDLLTQYHDAEYCWPISESAPSHRCRPLASRNTSSNANKG